MIASLLRNTVANFVAGTFVFAAIMLVLMDIYTGLISSIDIFKAPSVAGDIERYVLFSSHKHGNFEVVTGIRFHSSSRREIDKQWCYLTNRDSTKVAARSITLATVNGAGKPKLNNITRSNLHGFDLGNASIKAFVKSHCRFR